MKIFLVFPILFLSLNSYSQNWAPISLNDKYNYQVDSASYISNTIWIDSVNVINSDSVFSLNKIVQDCFECPWSDDPFVEFKIANQS